jgi:hypothetical protein
MHAERADGAVEAVRAGSAQTGGEAEAETAVEASLDAQQSDRADGSGDRQANQHGLGEEGQLRKIHAVIFRWHQPQYRCIFPAY